MKIFSTTKNLVLVGFLISSLVINVATIASTAVATALSGMFTAVTGFSTVVGRNKETVGNITKRISKRTVKAAARNAGSLAAEAIPYVGVAVIIGVTTLDLIDACDTMREIQSLNKEFRLESSASEDANDVCGKKIPDIETIWTDAKAGPEKAWEEAAGLVPNLPSFSDIVDETTTAFYVTFDRAQNGAVEIVTDMGSIVDAMLSQFGAGANSITIATAKAFKAALKLIDWQ